MNKADYQWARALIRQNGAYAYRWLSDSECACLKRLAAQPPDLLRLRAKLAGCYGCEPGYAMRLFPLRDSPNNES